MRKKAQQEEKVQEKKKKKEKVQDYTKLSWGIKLHYRDSRSSCSATHIQLISAKSHVENTRGHVSTMIAMSTHTQFSL